MTSGLMSFFFAISANTFFFALGTLVLGFVTLFDAPWKARVDCDDLVAGPETRRLGGILDVRGGYWMRWLVVQGCDACARWLGDARVVVIVSSERHCGLARDRPCTFRVGQTTRVTREHVTLFYYGPSNQIALSIALRLQYL
jgi:hypothetical protein